MRLGIPPERLQSAVEKVLRYSRFRFGVALDEVSYPSLNERRQVVKETTDLFSVRLFFFYRAEARQARQFER